MNRKKIKRTNTCDLTLGGVVAPPPPTGSLSVPVVSDIIDCFNHNGEPLATSDLVPVAMVMHMYNIAGNICWNLILLFAVHYKKLIPQSINS